MFHITQIHIKNVYRMREKKHTYTHTMTNNGQQTKILMFNGNNCRGADK